MIFPKLLCECALWSHTYIPGFVYIRSGLGNYSGKPFLDPENEQYSFFEPIIILHCYWSVARIAELMLSIVVCLQITVRGVGQTVS